MEWDWVLQKDRTVTTTSAMAQSLSRWLSQQKGFFFFLFWTLRTHHISPTLPGSLHTRPNQLSRDEDEGLGSCVCPCPDSEVWLNTDSARETAVTDLYNYTTHSHTNLTVSLTMWQRHCIVSRVSLSIQYSSFLSRLILSSRLKNAKVPQGEVRIPVHYSRNSPNTLTDDLKFSA